MGRPPGKYGDNIEKQEYSRSLDREYSCFILEGGMFSPIRHDHTSGIDDGEEDVSDEGKGDREKGLLAENRCRRGEDSKMLGFD